MGSRSIGSMLHKTTSGFSRWLDYNAPLFAGAFLVLAAWDLATLKVVLSGRLPVSRLVAEVNWTSPGLAEMNLVNRGEQDESLPAKVLTRWTDGSLLQAADGLGGYSLASDQIRAGLVTLAVAQLATGERIAPGRSRKVAWMRFSHETLLHPQIVASP